MARLRADEMLVEKSLAEDLEHARRLIMAGLVRTGKDTLIHKSSELMKNDAAIFVNTPMPYVSRGALKIKEAVERILLEPQGLRAIDLGSSTGGFTDLLLQHGVEHVYCVDVGKGQLHMKLRNDERVSVREGVNGRRLDSSHIPELLDLLVTDVSFISLTKVLPSAANFLKPGALCFVLIKPQFEVERHLVKDGIIRDEALRLAMVDKIRDFCLQELQWQCLEVKPSPLKGPKGNQEYVAVMRTAEKEA